MMNIDRNEELELFAFLARQDNFRKWLLGKLEAETKVLISNNDIEQLRKSQGKAQLLQQLLDLLEKSHAAVARR